MIQYIVNIVLAFSKLMRAFLGGNGSESLSQATAKGYLVGKWWCVYLLKPSIDWFFKILINEDDHVMKSIEEGPSSGKTLWDWGK